MAAEEKERQRKGMTKEMTQEEIRSRIAEYREWMIGVRRHLHRCPETGDEEYETTAYIESLLKEMGIRTEKLLDTGVLGILDAEDRGGKCVALRADIDALPVQEETDLAFRSQRDGFMHACGHDMHMAALLCTAKILSDLRGFLTAPVKFIFQPAEETDGGAERMIRAGCLENPRADYVLGYHVAPEYPAGTIAVKYGYTHASSDMFDIEVVGVKSHGAYPDEGIDAIVAASQIVTAVQSIVSRNIVSTDPCVITIGKFLAGSAGNVIADKAEMSGTMRTTTPQTRKVAMQRLKETAEGVAQAMGARAFVRYRPGYIAQKNDDSVMDVVMETAEECIGKENIFIKEYPSMGVEDFAFYSRERPSAFFFVGTGYRGRKNYGIHHGKFEADESALDIAVLMEIMTCLKLMSSGTDS